MSKLIRIATPLMAVAIMSSVPFLALAQTSQSFTSNPSSSSEAATTTTPPVGSQMSQQGYKDGVEAAKLDKLTKRPIAYKSSHLYVNPPVKKDARDAYRSAFQAGYEAAVAQTAS